MNEYIDVSVPLHNGLVHWPGDPAFSIHRVLDQQNGDVCTVSHISLGVHTGTHMDAPLHFIKDTPTMEQMPLDAIIGPARVIAIQDRKSITRAELEPWRLQEGERVIFKTANSEKIWHDQPFDEDFIFIDHSGAQHLAECKVRTVGVDYLSVGGYKQDAVETHRALLGAGIWVVEGLALMNVEPGAYEFICLPLKLVGSDGAPARAILRKTT